MGKIKEATDLESALVIVAEVIYKHKSIISESQKAIEKICDISRESRKKLEEWELVRTKLLNGEDTI